MDIQLLARKFCEYSTHMRGYSSHTIARNYLSSNGALTLKFTSDASTSSSGFVVGWVAHAPPSDCSASVAGIANLEKETVSLYPNPTTDVITLQNLTPHSIVSVTNILGESVLSGTSDNEGKLTLSTSNIPAGMYFANGMKFVKQ